MTPAVIAAATVATFLGAWLLGAYVYTDGPDRAQLPEFERQLWAQYRGQKLTAETWRDDIQFCRGLPGPVAQVVDCTDHMEVNEMLVLTRFYRERVVIDTSDGPISIQVVGLWRNRVRLGFDAPASVRVLREELVGRNLDKLGQNRGES